MIEQNKKKTRLTQISYIFLTILYLLFSLAGNFKFCKKMLKEIFIIVAIVMFEKSNNGQYAKISSLKELLEKYYFLFFVQL